jgi:hypothetical protein
MGKRLLGGLAVPLYIAFRFFQSREHFERPPLSVKQSTPEEKTSFFQTSVERGLNHVQQTGRIRGGKSRTIALAPATA